MSGLDAGQAMFCLQFLTLFLEDCIGLRFKVDDNVLVDWGSCVPVLRTSQEWQFLNMHKTDMWELNQGTYFYQQTLSGPRKENLLSKLM